MDSWNVWQLRYLLWGFVAFSLAGTRWRPGGEIDALGAAIGLWAGVVLVDLSYSKWPDRDGPGIGYRLGKWCRKFRK